MPKTPSDFLSFETPDDLRDWLAAHHNSATELWICIHKKGSGRPSIDWTDCVVESIAYGWIDGQKQSLDLSSYLQRITPRKAKSNWSKKNCEHAERLIDEGRMTTAGMLHIEAAKADGRWDNAYVGSSNMVIPQDFLTALESKPVSQAFYATLDRKNLFAIYYRLHTSKRPETREKRIKAILEQLARGERFH